jgi:Retrotransposon gag protein
MRELIRLGELIDATAPPSRTQTPFQTPYNPPNIPSNEPEERPERDDNMRANVGRSTDTTREPPRHPRGHPRGDGDDPYGLDDVLDEPIGKNNVRLEGIPPEKFTGERGQTIPFLTKFKRFILMNRDAAIARDPYKRSAFFLSLIGGTKTDGWVERSYDWLNRAERDPSILPYDTTAWEVLESEFRRAFVDYAEHEKAQDEIQRLKMTNENVDQYIADFERLGHRAGLDLDDPMALRLFACSLPVGLADSCIDIENPETFEQWTKAAQRHYRNWLRKHAIHSNYGGTNSQQQNQKGNQGGNSFYWRRSQQNQNNNSPSRSRWQAKDPNAMDTSAVARKATTDAEKEQHRKEGRCFECSQQGHLARNCPNRKPVTVHRDRGSK